MKITNYAQSQLCRGVAVFLVLSFTLTTVAWSAPVLPFQNVPHARSLAAHVEIPESLGRIEERFIPQAKPQSTIFHIQDAHAHLEAQQKTHAILQHLEDHYGVNTLFLEGGFGDLDAKNIQFFKEKDLNERFANMLLKEGILSGAEHYAFSKMLQDQVTAPKMYGVENGENYRTNLIAYRQVIGKLGISKAFLRNFKSRFLSEASRHFNKDLKDFFRQWSFYEENQKDLLGSLALLKDYAKEQLKLDLSDIRQQYDWPNLTRFFKLQEMEEKVNDQQVALEQERLTAWLEEQNVDSIYLSFDHRSNFLDRRDYAEKLYEATKDLGFRFEDYPSLSQFWGLEILQEEIDGMMLYSEVEQVTRQILDSLSQTEIEKSLLALYFDSRLLSKLLHLELSHQDYLQVLEAGKRLIPSTMMQRLKQTEIIVERSSRLFASNPEDILFENALVFYEAAKKREQVIFENLRSKMAEIKKDNAVLVTGGFHADGLQDYFKQNQMAYVEIFPHITEVGEAKDYQEILMLTKNTEALRSTLHTIVPTTARSEIRKVDAGTEKLYRDINSLLQDSVRSEMRSRNKRNRRRNNSEDPAERQWRIRQEENELDRNLAQDIVDTEGEIERIGKEISDLQWKKIHLMDRYSDILDGYETVRNRESVLKNLKLEMDNIQPTMETLLEQKERLELQVDLLEDQLTAQGTHLLKGMRAERDRIFNRSEVRARKKDNRSGKSRSYQKSRGSKSLPDQRFQLDDIVDPQDEAEQDTVAQILNLEEKVNLVLHKVSVINADIMHIQDISIEIRDLRELMKPYQNLREAVLEGNQRSKGEFGGRSVDVRVTFDYLDKIERRISGTTINELFSEMEELGDLEELQVEVSELIAERDEIVGQIHELEAKLSEDYGKGLLTAARSRLYQERSDEFDEFMEKSRARKDEADSENRSELRAISILDRSKDEAVMVGHRTLLTLGKIDHRNERWNISVFTPPATTIKWYDPRAKRLNKGNGWQEQKGSTSKEKNIQRVIKPRTQQHAHPPNQITFQTEVTAFHITGMQPQKQGDHIALQLISGRDSVNNRIKFLTAEAYVLRELQHFQNTLRQQASEGENEVFTFTQEIQDVFIGDEKAVERKVSMVDMADEGLLRVQIEGMPEIFIYDDTDEHYHIMGILDKHFPTDSGSEEPRSEVRKFPAFVESYFAMQQKDKARFEKRMAGKQVLKKKYIREALAEDKEIVIGIPFNEEFPVDLEVAVNYLTQALHEFLHEKIKRPDAKVVIAISVEARVGLHAIQNQLSSEAIFKSDNVRVLPFLKPSYKGDKTYFKGKAFSEGALMQIADKVNAHLAVIDADVDFGEGIHSARSLINALLTPYYKQNKVQIVGLNPPRRFDYDDGMVHAFTYLFTGAVYGQPVRQLYGGEWSAHRDRIKAFRNSPTLALRDNYALQGNVMTASLADSQGYRSAEKNMRRKRHQNISVDKIIGRAPEIVGPLWNAAIYDLESSANPNMAEVTRLELPLNEEDPRRRPLSEFAPPHWREALFGRLINRWGQQDPVFLRTVWPDHYDAIQSQLLRDFENFDFPPKLWAETTAQLFQYYRARDNENDQAELVDLFLILLFAGNLGYLAKAEKKEYSYLQAEEMLLDQKYLPAFQEAFQQAGLSLARSETRSTMKEIFEQLAATLKNEKWRRGKLKDAQVIFKRIKNREYRILYKESIRTLTFEIGTIQEESQKYQAVRRLTFKDKTLPVFETGAKEKPPVVDPSHADSFELKMEATDATENVGTRILFEVPGVFENQLRFWNQVFEGTLVFEFVVEGEKVESQVDTAQDPSEVAESAQDLLEDFIKRKLEKDWEKIYLQIDPMANAYSEGTTTIKTQPKRTGDKPGSKQAPQITIKSLNGDIKPGGEVGEVIEGTGLVDKWILIEPKPVKKSTKKSDEAPEQVEDPEQAVLVKITRIFKTNAKGEIPEGNYDFTLDPDKRYGEAELAEYDAAKDDIRFRKKVIVEVIGSSKQRGEGLITTESLKAVGDAHRAFVIRPKERSEVRADVEILSPVFVVPAIIALSTTISLIVLDRKRKAKRTQLEQDYPQTIRAIKDAIDMTRKTNGLEGIEVHVIPWEKFPVSIWEHEGNDPSFKATFYGEKPTSNGILMTFFNHNRPKDKEKKWVVVTSRSEVRLDGMDPSLIVGAVVLGAVAVSFISWRIYRDVTKYHRRQKVRNEFPSAYKRIGSHVERQVTKWLDNSDASLRFKTIRWEKLPKRILKQIEDGAEFTLEIYESSFAIKGSLRVDFYYESATNFNEKAELKIKLKIKSSRSEVRVRNRRPAIHPLDRYALRSAIRGNYFGTAEEVEAKVNQVVHNVLMRKKFMEVLQSTREESAYIRWELIPEEVIASIDRGDSYTVRLSQVPFWISNPIYKLHTFLRSFKYTRWITWGRSFGQVRIDYHRSGFVDFVGRGTTNTRLVFKLKKSSDQTSLSGWTLPSNVSLKDAFNSSDVSIFGTAYPDEHYDLLPGQIVYVNPTFLSKAGGDDLDWMGKRYDEKNSMEDAIKFQKDDRRALGMQGQNFVHVIEGENNNIETVKLRFLHPQTGGYMVLAMFVVHDGPQDPDKEIDPRLQAVIDQLTPPRSEVRQLPSRPERLQNYEKTAFNRMKRTKIYEAQNIAEGGDLLAVEVIRELQYKLPLIGKGKNVVMHFATGNTPWMGYTRMVQLLDTWESNETQEFLKHYGLDPEPNAKPDMKRVIAFPLDALFPQKRSAYHSFANILNNMFEKLGIPEENRHFFYGDVENGAGEPMSDVDYEKLQADIDENGLLIEEFLEWLEDDSLHQDLWEKHPEQSDFLDAFYDYSVRMSELIKELGGAHIYVNGIGPSYAGKGHVGFMEGGTPFSQGLLMGIVGYHMAADHMKEDGGMEALWAKNKKKRYGFVTYGFEELLHREDVKVITIATDNKKTESIRRGVETRPHNQYPMTRLQRERGVLILDKTSAADLRYNKNPWDFQEAIEWTDALVAQLFVQLSEETGKPISKVIQNDLKKSKGADDPEINRRRMANFARFKRERNWNQEKQKVASQSEKNLVRTTDVSKRLGLKPNSTITIINPHLDDEYLAMRDQIKEFSDEGHQIHVYYVAKGYTAVHSSYALNALEHLTNIDESFLEYGFGVTQEKEREYLQRLMEVIEEGARRGEDLHKDPNDYDTWNHMHEHEKMLRAQLLYIQLYRRFNRGKEEKGRQRLTKKQLQGLLETLKLVNDAKPQGGAQDIELMKDIKVYLRFTEAQTGLMSLGVPYENIHFPFDATWYGAVRGGTATEQDIDDVQLAIANTRPDLVIVNGENFADFQSHSTTQASTIAALLQLTEIKTGINPKVLYYRGVWDRTHTSGLINQISIVLEKTALTLFDILFRRHWPSQSPPPVPDSSLTQSEHFSVEVIMNAQKTLSEIEALIGADKLQSLLKKKGFENPGGILNFNYIEDLKDPETREKLATWVQEWERVKEPVKRASSSSVNGPVPYPNLSGPVGRQVLKILKNSDIDLGFFFDSDKDELNTTGIKKYVKTIRSEVRSFVEQQTIENNGWTIKLSDTRIGDEIEIAKPGGTISSILMRYGNGRGVDEWEQAARAEVSNVYSFLRKKLKNRKIILAKLFRQIPRILHIHLDNGSILELSPETDKKDEGLKEIQSGSDELEIDLIEQEGQFLAEIKIGLKPGDVNKKTVTDLLVRHKSIITSLGDFGPFGFQNPHEVLGELEDIEADPTIKKVVGGESITVQYLVRRSEVRSKKEAIRKLKRVEKGGYTFSLNSNTRVLNVQGENVDQDMTFHQDVDLDDLWAYFTKILRKREISRLSNLTSMSLVISLTDNTRVMIDIFNSIEHYASNDSQPYELEPRPKQIKTESRRRPVKIGVHPPSDSLGTYDRLPFARGQENPAKDKENRSELRQAQDAVARQVVFGIYRYALLANLVEAHTRTILQTLAPWAEAAEVPYDQLVTNFKTEYANVLGQSSSVKPHGVYVYGFKTSTEYGPALEQLNHALLSVVMMPKKRAGDDAETQAFRAAMDIANEVREARGLSKIIVVEGPEALGELIKELQTTERYGQVFRARDIFGRYAFTGDRAALVREIPDPENVSPIATHALESLRASQLSALFEQLVAQTLAIQASA